MELVLNVSMDEVTTAVTALWVTQVTLKTHVQTSMNVVDQTLVVSTLNVSTLLDLSSASAHRDLMVILISFVKVS